MVIGNGWGSTERGKKSSDTVAFAVGRGREISVLFVVIVTKTTFVNCIIVQTPSLGGEGVGDTIVVEIPTATNIAMVPSIILTKNMTVVAIINIFLSGMKRGREEKKTPSKSPLGSEKTVVVVITNATVVNILMMQSASRREEGGGSVVEGMAWVVEIPTATIFAMVPIIIIIPKNMTVVVIINIFPSGMGGGGREKEGRRCRRRWGGRI